MKTDYALKMKVLLEKTDNDDKLIKALKEELRGKGGSSPAKQTLGVSIINLRNRTRTIPRSSYKMQI